MLDDGYELYTSDELEGKGRIEPDGIPRWLTPVSIVVAIVSAVGYEARTSKLQASLLSQYASRLDYTVGPGRSQSIVFPDRGPLNEQRGYARLEDFTRRLVGAGYLVAEQARFSPDLARLTAWGLPPPYREPARTGLVLRGADGGVLFDPVAPGRVFRDFDEIPGVIWRSLLFIENRELEAPGELTSNPAIEWDRLTRAGLCYVGRHLGFPLRVEGGSTLATQIEKYHHSPDGRTGSVLEKLRQIATASLKVYRHGIDTTTERREIILEYLNTVPLAAAPHYGEVHGLGEGLAVWYGMSLDDVRHALAEPALGRDGARAVKHILALLCAVRAPSNYLLQDREGLEWRTNSYIRLLAQAGMIEPDLARRALVEPVVFANGAPAFTRLDEGRRKGVNAIRNELSDMLGVPGFHELDLLHLEVRSTIDTDLQDDVAALFRQLSQPSFLENQGLFGDRLLADGDPCEVLYSFLLFERTPQGNLLRAQVDSLDAPLDLNQGMKLELGSTAKLRTLSHYLGLVSDLHRAYAGQTPKALASSIRTARDPITRWVLRTFRSRPEMGLDELLASSLERSYSASPGEIFFTGGGVHTFQNFDPDDDGRMLTVREALRSSTNMVFIRLMRDIVLYHEARLPYDTDRVLSDPDDPDRLCLLERAADDEARQTMTRVYRRLQGKSVDGIIRELLGARAATPRDLVLLDAAWNQGAVTEKKMGGWLGRRLATQVPEDEIRALIAGYAKPSFTLKDYAYLLHLHPLEVWVAGEMVRNSEISLTQLEASGNDARQLATAWLFEPRNRRAQDVRLRIRMEEDAFSRMTPEWRKLGFPFQHLVPSLATAIGSSSDRPAALAQLMGIILNDGVRLPSVRLLSLRFAEGTPYHTVFERTIPKEDRVMDPQVARLLREVLAEVVEGGTARRVAGAFHMPDGTPVACGGKTGSGDNRFEKFSRGGQLLSSQPVSRTATFVFYVGDRYFGVITALVPGQIAGNYSFTSALPVTVLKIVAPVINKHLAPVTQPPVGFSEAADRHETPPPTPAKT